MTDELSQIRKAIEESGAAAVEELRRLQSPHAQLLEDCFDNIAASLRALQFGESLRNARELATTASERAQRIRGT